MKYETSKAEEAFRAAGIRSQDFSTDIQSQNMLFRNY